MLLWIQINFIRFVVKYCLLARQPILWTFVFLLFRTGEYNPRKYAISWRKQSLTTDGTFDGNWMFL